MTDTVPPGRRLSPHRRRKQLLDLGVRMLATRHLEDLSLDLLASEAGISRGLIYHYFGSKQEFHAQVVRRAADDLLDRTLPPDEGNEAQKLLHVVSAYVDYVSENPQGYLSLMRAGAGGNDALFSIHDRVRIEMTERTYQAAVESGVLLDQPLARMLVRAGIALIEELVLNWIEEPGGVTRSDLLVICVRSAAALASISKSLDEPGSLRELADGLSAGPRADVSTEASA